jgi:hypothetical protein
MNGRVLFTSGYTANVIVHLTLEVRFPCLGNSRVPHRRG